MPGSAGVNVTFSVHEPPFGTLLQELVWLNSPAFVPMILISFIMRSDMPVFLIVIVLGVEEFPTVIEPNFIDSGKKQKS